MTTLLCHECGKSFTDEPLLNIHQTRQPDKTSYSCGECGTEVIGKMALNNHKRRHKMPAVKNLEKKHKATKGIFLRRVPLYYNDKGLSEGPHKENACCQRCGLDVCGGSLRKKNQEVENWHGRKMKWFRWRLREEMRDGILVRQEWQERQEKRHTTLSATAPTTFEHSIELLSSIATRWKDSPGAKHYPEY